MSRKCEELEVRYMEISEEDDSATYLAHCLEPEVMMRLEAIFSPDCRDIHIDITNVQWIDEQPIDADEVVICVAENLTRQMSKGMCLMWGEEEPPGGIFEPVTHFAGKRIH